MSNLGDGEPDLARSCKFAPLNQIKIVDKTQSNGVRQTTCIVELSHLSAHCNF